MRLSASGKGFAGAYLNEAQEVFLDGHVRAFEHFGGVPRRVRYDNLKAAVEKVLEAATRDDTPTPNPRWGTGHRGAPSSSPMPETSHRPERALHRFHGLHPEIRGSALSVPHPKQGL